MLLLLSSSDRLSLALSKRNQLKANLTTEQSYSQVEETQTAVPNLFHKDTMTFKTFNFSQPLNDFNDQMETWLIKKNNDHFENKEYLQMLLKGDLYLPF